MQADENDLDELISHGLTPFIAATAMATLVTGSQKKATGSA